MPREPKDRSVGDADVGLSDLAKQAESAEERKLEQGLEESMAGSDPISVTQPLKPRAPK